MSTARRASSTPVGHALTPGAHEPDPCPGRHTPPHGESHRPPASGRCPWASRPPCVRAWRNGPWQAERGPSRNGFVLLTGRGRDLMRRLLQKRGEVGEEIEPGRQPAQTTTGQGAAHQAARGCAHHHVGVQHINAHRVGRVQVPGRPRREALAAAAPTVVAFSRLRALPAPGKRPRGSARSRVGGANDSACPHTTPLQYPRALRTSSRASWWT